MYRNFAIFLEVRMNLFIVFFIRTYFSKAKPIYFLLKYYTSVVLRKYVHLERLRSFP